MTAITKLHIAIYGCILNQKDELLIVKRSPTDTSPNIWEMPGGSLELGEDVVTGIIREVNEETGIKITPLYPVVTVSGISSRDQSKQVIRIAYLTQLVSDNQTVRLSSEHSEYQWVNPFECNLNPLSDLLEEVLLTMKRYPFLFK